MNKKGFATSTIVFTLLSVFLISISILLVTITNTNKTKNTLNEKVVSNIEYGNSSINDLEQRVLELENNALKIDDIYPVGSIYISETDSSVNDVKERFGGEWEAYASGKTLIGSGTGTDINGTVQTFSVSDNNKNLGEYTHKLTIAELPSHTHEIPTLSVSSWSGSHTHHTLLGQAKFNLPNTGTNNYFVSSYDYNGTKKHFTTSNDINTQATTITVSGQKTTASTSVATGKNASFNINNPYITVYIYKRVK